ncbi:triose-phosphate isomerase [Candidatus Kaiserbacteria bacterium]|nr:triose-phosphate isomerase [Candidatus Kaiserbacteria bacterium]
MKSIVVANWKMHPATFKEAKQLFEATKKAAEKAKGVSVIVAPPAIYLREIVKLYKGRRVAFAMQDGNAEAVGACTGEISIAQGKDSKAGYVIIAHAERRSMGETNDGARRKVSAALNSKMTPVLCVGEASRDGTGEHFNFIKEQLRIGLADVTAPKVSQVIIAYEPVWAIGATRPMEAHDMHEMAIFIRKSIVETHGKDGMNMKILYGGSIDETNAAGMLRDGDIAGFLVGRASTEATKCAALIHSLSEA